MFRLPRCFPAIVVLSLLCFGQSPNERSTSTDAQSPSQPAVGPRSDLLREANVFYRRGDFGHAILKYKEVLQEVPKSPDGWAGLVRSLIRAKNVAAAAQTAEQALATMDHPKIHSAHAEVLFRQGDPIEAEKEWVAVVNSGYPDARAYLGIARVRQANSMYAGAAKMIRKAHDLNPDDPDIKELWLTTLPPAQRIEQLRSLLAEETDVDESQRTEISNFLDHAAEWRKDHECALVSKVTTAEIPLLPASKDVKHRRGYRVSVTLNGRQQPLLLDTGASGILVGRSFAREAGITKFIPTMIKGIGGMGWTSASIGFADSVKIGEFEFHNCPIRITDDYSLTDEGGLMGTDVFQKFLVDIDFPDQKLKLSELPGRPGEPRRALSLSSGDSSLPSQDEQENENVTRDRYIAPEMQSFTPVYRFGHLLLVATSIGDVPPKLFVLDTGAASNFISRSAAEEVTKVRRRSNISVTGLGGSVNDVYTAKKTVLRFGHLSQENQEMIGFDTAQQSDNAGIEISGFLGFTTLRMLDITIDYRDGLVNFSYDAKKWKDVRRHHR